MLLLTNRNPLRELRVDSPLTEEASEVIYKLPNLHSLSVAIEKGIPLPSASLPNLIDLKIRCDSGDNWLRPFHGATFGKLKSVFLDPIRLTTSSGHSKGPHSLHPSRIRSRSSIFSHCAHGIQPIPPSFHLRSW